ncbi:hypothetical protein D9M68_17850 [compost metagenome]
MSQLRPLSETHPQCLVGDIMAKEAVYYEDLQKTVFVIKVITDAGSYLEQRQWHKNDYENQPGDDFDRFREGKPTYEERYEWIAARSDLMGVSVDTEKWMDRKWVPVGKQA